MYPNSISNDTPVAMLTVGQLKEALKPNVEAVVSTPKKPQQNDKYVFGLRGIRNLFGVSLSTAQRYKNTFLKPAIKQNSRKIIIDVEKALELFNSQSK